MSRPLELFVIMPFDPAFDTVYSLLLKKPLEAEGYSIRRADDLSKHQNILREVVRGIESADMVLAELSTLNANVLYELGIAHSMNKPTILLTQDIDEIPFDLRPYAVIPYSDKFDKAFELVDAICSIIKRFVDGTYTFSNPVNDFRTYQDENSNSLLNFDRAIVVDEKADDMESDEYGSLDYITLAYTAMKELTDLANFFTDKQTWLSQRLRFHTDEITKLNTNPDKQNALAKRNKISRDSANDMTDFAKALESQQSNMTSAWSNLSDGLENYLIRVQLKTGADLQSAKTFYNQMCNFYETTTKTRSQLELFQKSLSSTKGISKDLNRASDRIDRGMSKLIEGFMLGEASGSRVLQLLKELIDNNSNLDADIDTGDSD